MEFSSIILPNLPALCWHSIPAYYSFYASIFNAGLYIHGKTVDGEVGMFERFW